jgi:hypothetical protein
MMKTAPAGAVFYCSACHKCWRQHVAPAELTLNARGDFSTSYVNIDIAIAFLFIGNTSTATLR